MKYNRSVALIIIQHVTQIPNYKSVIEIYEKTAKPQKLLNWQWLVADNKNDIVTK